MSEVRLGRVFLGWCRSCNLPLLSRVCSLCGADANVVNITPPGDYRPAFPGEVERMEGVIERDFGVLLHLTHPTILNKIPDIDEMREVINGGLVIGAIRYDIFAERERFLPRVPFAQKLVDEGTDKFVVADSGAVSSVLKSSNLLCPGVVGCGDFDAGDEVMVIDGNKRVLAVGNARMGSDDIKDRGIAVKIRARERGGEKFLNGPLRGFEEVIKLEVEANREHIESRVGSSVKFVRRVLSRNELPVACSLSGGKDSMATLLLLLEAGIEPTLLFTDTGLEFDETIEEVHRTAESTGLKLIEESARSDFWSDIGIFGNLGRDHRWCCKTRKLAPMVKLIDENFPEGVLTFIGQRRYESMNRAKHGSIWKNPWLKKQVGVSCIQNWNAMEVWLYLFSRDARTNPLYERGFERIGCWLCPASDLFDFELFKHRDHERYFSYLKEHYDDEAVSLGLWRFRDPPNWAPENHMRIEEKREGCVVPEGAKLRIRGDRERIDNISKAIGVSVFDGMGRENEKLVRKIVYRANYCAGCGLCETGCENNAIYLRDGKSWISEDVCISCGSCLDLLCPATEYMD